MINAKTLLCAAAIIACATVTATADGTAHANQIGFRTGEAKSLILVNGTSDPVTFYNGTTVTFTATPGSASTWDPSGESVRIVDFSGLTAAGTYTAKQGSVTLRSDITVSDDPYKTILQGALKFYYYQRASTALTAEYAGTYARDEGHPDNSVTLHSSTGASGKISSPKGWYDAGDYGKYIVNSGISTYTLLSLYEHFPVYFKAFKWNIPADGSLPDLLAEIKWNLDWMLTMQASDGGVYHKLTTLQFSGTVMPAKDTDTRYVIGKSAAASFDFAAVMATAYRVYKDLDATYAAKCLAAAKSAYTWGAANTSALFTANPSDVGTGTYADNDIGDEQAFAAAELYVSTQSATYKLNGTRASIPGWQYEWGLVTYSKASHATLFGNDGAAAKDSLLKLADELVTSAESGYGVPMRSGDFYWGSNSVAANEGVWLLYAYYLTGEKKYFNAARAALDYLLGKNPLDMSFVTGFGTKSPKNPHHRPSQADGIAAPVPGMLVGGPHSDGGDIGSNSWECKDYRTGYPATSYYDNTCSYATNEVAINWNAPLSYLIGALEALASGETPTIDGNKVIAAIRPALRHLQETSGPALFIDGRNVRVRLGNHNYDLRGVQIK